MFIQAALLTLSTVLLCISSVWAQASQPARMPASEPTSCSVKHVSDPCRSEFAFSGRVHAGEIYRCELSHTLIFELVPVSDGWQIAIRGDKSDENLARSVPAFWMPLPDNQIAVPVIEISGLQTGSKAGENDKELKMLPQDRKFTFSASVGRPTEGTIAGTPSSSQQIEQGSGLFRITGLELNNVQPDQKTSISQISFEVSMQVDARRWVYKVGGGVSPPKLIYAPDPEYSAEARRAKYQGTVVLWMIVECNGQPGDIRVARSIGMGLDEKAIEAVSRWRFTPAMKAGKPVRVMINVEIAFRL